VSLVLATPSTVLSSLQPLHINRHDGEEVFKTSPGKKTRPGRKTIIRIKDKYYKRDIVSRLQTKGDDLLKPFGSAEKIKTIQQRLTSELSLLDDSIKANKNPEKYHVEFV